MKPLLVGEAPSKNEPLPAPLEGRCGRRLAEFSGLSFEKYLARFERVNLLSVRQDTTAHGFVFDLAAARRTASSLVACIESGRLVALLGKRVASAFGLRSSSYFAPCYLPNDATLYVVPHPSGINRWYNDAPNRAEMARFMRRLVEGGSIG